MESEQEIREYQREYLDFLDDEVLIAYDITEFFSFHPSPPPPAV